ncbi:MAG: CPBP family intramembrane metalloprotease [Bacteroidia bacterium]|nr:CPBP family intramembrane metalloprotease [Bacteroidia bacterium]
MNKYKLPLLATVLAIAITTTMDFTGYLQFSALPLFGLIFIFWLILRLSREEIGLKWGRLQDYGIAILYPFVVLGATVLIAFALGEIDLSQTNWPKTLKMIGIGGSIGILMGLLTEEGFFRGWLWGAFQRKGMNAQRTLWVTSIIFTIWHISAVTSGTEYGLPWGQVPVYLINATFLGLIWGMMRLISGSIVVASVSHAIWNALAYELFGFGEGVGALGIANTALFGPEVGILGILLNGLFFAWLWNIAKKNGAL